jgi:hypothetical protein
VSVSSSTDSRRPKKSDRLNMPPTSEEFPRDFFSGVAGPTTATSSAPVTNTAWAPMTWALLLVVCGALFLDALDTSMVSVALL